MQGLFLQEVAEERTRDLRNRGAAARRARVAASRRGGGTVRRLRHIGLLLSRR